MIIDTSVLVAMVYGEPGIDEISHALARERGFIPAPVLVELHRVTSDTHNILNPNAVELIRRLESLGHVIVPFDTESADEAIKSNRHFGTGNGSGGQLNMLDLMVYGTAKARDLPILFTGNDFASTDAKIHPASGIG